MSAMCARACACLISASAFSSPTALGSGFTYQAQLKQNGVAINGAATLRFSLWDSAGAGSPPAGGNQLGMTQQIANLPISNGLFTVALNDADQFGVTALNGQGRWLQIEVCGDSNCVTRTILTPRQPVAATPYAAYAYSSPKGHALDASDGLPIDALFVDNAGNIGIGTTTPNKRLTVDGDMEIGIQSSDYQHLHIGGGNSDGFLYGSFPRFGDGIHIGYNYFADATGANRIIRTDGQTSRISMGYGYVSLATGGTNQNPVERLFVNTNGNVGIGTVAPVAKLQVGGDVVVDGNIGIGTTNPISRLHVTGSTFFQERGVIYGVQTA